LDVVEEGEEVGCGCWRLILEGEEVDWMLIDKEKEEEG